MGLTDQGLHPEIYDDYRIETVDPSWLQERVKPKRHIGLTPECIWMLAPDVIQDAENPEVLTLAQSASATFIIDDNECTRCAICVERCPSDALWLGRVES
jgi:ferredoxin